MGHIIAVAGKGGVGKTTLTGLLIQYLCESGKKPVLAVDADANANLNRSLVWRSNARCENCGKKLNEQVWTAAIRFLPE